MTNVGVLYQKSLGHVLWKQSLGHLDGATCRIAALLSADFTRTHATASGQKKNKDGKTNINCHNSSNIDKISRNTANKNSTAC